MQHHRHHARAGLEAEVEGVDRRCGLGRRHDVAEWVHNRSVNLVFHVAYAKNCYFVFLRYVGCKVDLKVGESAVYHRQVDVFPAGDGTTEVLFMALYCFIFVLVLLAVQVARVNGLRKQCKQSSQLMSVVLLSSKIIETMLSTHEVNDMTQSKVKIVSNPYARSVTFQRWDDGWVPITSESNPNSRLLDRRIVEGFLPFMIKEVVDIVLDEYRAGDGPIRINFEGADDEYRELESFCESGSHRSSIILERSNRKLSVACEVLPEIIESFKGVRPLVDECVLSKQKLSDELERFEDVSSDVVPICVFGNCSSGKSTFINALIGYELLPSGDEPVTARVYQIRRSKQPEHGSIDFYYDDKRVMLDFWEEEISGNIEYEKCELFPSIQGAISETETAGVIQHMNRVLGVLNSYRSAEPGRGVSDRISVTVPFNPADRWAESRDFVICDTPGSNTVTHEDHLRVLKNALEGMSNGLPVYVAELDSLDTTDNGRLYEEIKGIDAVDERFVMIIVNKADVASLPKGGFVPEKIIEIKSHGVPSNLNSQGIYFVSSILGLGTKINGEFESESYTEKFEDQSEKFSNPEHKRYKRLYSYNILPGQISERTVGESEAYASEALADDGEVVTDANRLLFANSGLYCIEQEILRFAEKYSAYNKCQQSEYLLKRIIDVTSDEIEAEKARREEARSVLQNKLEEGKEELKLVLKEAALQAEREATKGYSESVDKNFDPSRWSIVREKLMDSENELVEEMRARIGYDNFDDDAKQAWRTIGESFLDDISSAFDRQSADLLASSFVRLVDNFGTWRDKQVSLYEADRHADSKASDALLEKVKDDFNKAVDSIASEVQTASKVYWEQCSNSARTVLKEIATTNTVLSEERRKELEDVILRYPALTLVNDADDIFTRPAFERDFKLWNALIAESAKLNLGKIKSVYNDEIGNVLAEVRDKVREGHEQSFITWLQELLKLILDNITDYNPSLHDYVVGIKEHSDRIDDLEEKVVMLRGHESRVSQMIGWKE